MSSLDGSRKNEKKSKQERRTNGGLKIRLRKGRYLGGHDGDEVKEMWDTVAWGDSKDDRNRVGILDDDNIINDTGVDPADRYGSDNEPWSPGSAP